MKIKQNRKKIDTIDARLIKLLNQRARLSRAIGKEKLKNQKTVFSPEREKEIFRRIKALNKGPMTAEALDAVYREILSGSRSLEKMLNVAYLGPQATFTHLAAQKKFGSQITYVPCPNISEVFQKVENGQCDYGVVPIENSIEGAVTHTFDLLADSDLKICSQILLEISHNLLSRTSLAGIKKIYSKLEVFGQCRHWLNVKVPRAELIDVSSTTRAAQLAATDKSAACIASSLAAKVYNLKTVARDIEDVAHNITRFLVIAKNDVPPTGKDRTSVLFSIKDKVGALHAMLEPFSKNKINLTKIESRPSKKKAWDYYFFLDFEGHRDEKHVKRALQQLDAMCKHLKVLGSYPVTE